MASSVPAMFARSPQSATAPKTFPSSSAGTNWGLDGQRGFYAQMRFTMFYKHVTCEMRDLSRVSENLVTPPKSPEMNTIGTEALEKLFTLPYTMSLSHSTLPSPSLSPSPSCYHLKAKATSPMMVETKPRRQRG